MSKTRAVHFDDGYARVYVNPSEDILTIPGIIVNPDLSRVEHMPPEFWKLSGSEIVPMTEREKSSRLQSLDSEITATHAVLIRQPVEVVVFRMPTWAVVVMAVEAVALAVSLLIQCK